jgi:Na+-driven multidrug efflux pump
VLSVALDVILIPPFGGQGAAFAAAIAHTCAGLVVATLFFRTLGGGPSDLIPRLGDLRWFAAKLSARLKPKPA